MRALFAFIATICLMAGCGSEESSSNGAGCADPAHDGLACATFTRPEQIGVCSLGACMPLSCEVDDDCNDRAGHDFCREMTCEKSPEQFAGACTVTTINSGNSCDHPAGWTGTCAAGHCQ